RDRNVTGVQTCALPISTSDHPRAAGRTSPGRTPRTGGAPRARARRSQRWRRSRSRGRPGSPSAGSPRTPPSLARGSSHSPTRPALPTATRRSPSPHGRRPSAPSRPNPTPAAADVQHAVALGKPQLVEDQAVLILLRPVERLLRGRARRPHTLIPTLRGTRLISRVVGAGIGHGVAEEELVEVIAHVV